MLYEGPGGGEVDWQGAGRVLDKGRGLPASPRAALGWGCPASLALAPGEGAGSPPASKGGE